MSYLTADEFAKLYQAENPPEKVQPQRAVPEGPRPLRRETPLAQPYPLGELGPVLGPASEAINLVEQIPDAIAAHAVLSTAAHAAQGHYDVRLPFGDRPLSLFLISVAASGDRKTQADRIASSAVQQIERDMQAQYYEQLKEYELARDLHKEQKKTARTAAEREALEPEPERPRCPRLLTSDFTLDGLVKRCLESFPSVAVSSDEGAVFFGGHAMREENRRRTAAVFSQLWDGSAIDRVRSLDGATKLYDRRTTMHLMLQPVIAAEVFSDELLHGQGFLARVLTCYPVSLAGHRQFSTASAQHDPAIARLRREITRLWRTVEILNWECRPTPLPLSDGALGVFTALHDEIELQIGDGGELVPIRGFACKAAEHAARLAGIMTAIEDCSPTEINRERMERAAKLVNWYLDEALRLRAYSTTPPEIRAAERVLEWIRQKRRRRIYPSLIYQYGPSGIRDAKSARKAIDALVKHGYLIPLKGMIEIDDRLRREVFEVHTEAQTWL